MKNFITCFKDPVFLNFFYSRIRPVEGKTDRYERFRWVSPCGPETNFIEVDSVPIIWQFMAENEEGFLELEDSSKTFKIPFQPASLYIDEAGYLFHAGLARTGNVGLIKSPGLSEELYKNLQINANDEILSYRHIPVDGSTKLALKTLDDFGYLGKEEISDD